LQIFSGPSASPTLGLAALGNWLAALDNPARFEFASDRDAHGRRQRCRDPFGVCGYIRGSSR
jgi:hypothetical protein